MEVFRLKLCITWLILLIICNQLNAASVNKKHSNRIAKSDNENNQFNLKANLGTQRRCGYDGCPKPKNDMLNVHIVPHTHDDVGWLKTVDQYYYGSKTRIQTAGVQYIIDSVVQELLRDPNKRFIYVESAFFFKWWKEQTPELQDQVNQLVQEGRLEFIGGAWSMNDEAVTHYQSTIDQFTWGLRKLNDTFGECGRPRVGWQIDPFGHSRQFASLLAQMGYDGLFLGRIDYQDKVNRLTNKRAEMVWQASDNLGEKANMFTGILYNTYSPPPGFCFDVLCSDEPIIDNKHSTEYNVDRRLKEFDAYIVKQANISQTNNIILTMGGDFTYMDAQIYYKNLDLLIRYANERQASGSKINLFYSTPSCYLKALHDANITWPAKQDDFFPYASDPHSFWTGYFTSRPTLKLFERVGNHFLQVCKHLTALAPKKRSDFLENLTDLREVMGIMQHHDAITGTEKTHVANDYAYLLQKAITLCGKNTREALNQLTVEPNILKRYRPAGYDPNIQFDFSTCANLNISACEISENSERFVVTVYNPMAHSTYQYIRVPVTKTDFEVMDYRNVPIESQIVSIPNEIRALSYRISDASIELVFLASELPPLGYKSYFVRRLNSPKKETERQKPMVFLVQDNGFQSDQPLEFKSSPITIGNRYLNLTFDDNGLLSSMNGNGVEINIRQNFYVYEAAAGDNEEFKNRSSGAYIFRPNVTEARVISQRADIRVINGPIVDEVQQTFNEWISQVIRVNKLENIVEFEWLVGEIPVEDKIGREIITRFDTDIKSNGIFFTDLNGREMLQRKRNHRDTWDLSLLEKISGNYYPVTAKIAIEDNHTRLAVLTDRAQGGSSLSDGSIELMIHRRLLRDDAFGVGEALNETAFGKGLIVRGKHYLMFGLKHSSKQPSTEARERFVQLNKLLPSWLFFSDASAIPYNIWMTSYNHIYSALSLSLPQNVHLLTFEPWKENSILIRFEHILEIGEDAEYSKPVTFNFKDVFRKFDFKEIRETTLAANQWTNEAVRFKFAIETNVDKPTNVTLKSENGNNLTTSTNKEKREALYDIKPVISERQYRKTTYQNVYRNDELDDDNNFTITLQPMEIRTYVAKLEWTPEN